MKSTDSIYKNDSFDADSDWIQTYSGIRFCPLNPNYEAISILDIAHALSRQCRFSGHVSSYYSVAQHSVLVSNLCDKKYALWGLLHDASEAYLVDIPAPLKRSGKFDFYVEAESLMMKAICKRFNLPEEEHASIKMADQMLLATEAVNFMSPLHNDWINKYPPSDYKIESMLPDEAKLFFISRFCEIVGDNDLLSLYLKNKDIKYL